MPLTYVPTRLPTLEPVKRAIADALIADLAAALAEVTARHPSPAITLAVPKEVRLETVSRYEQIRYWPTVTVTGWNGRLESPAGEPIGGLWRAEIELAAFVQDTDGERLALTLDRYIEALWLVLLNGEPFAKARIVPESAAFEVSDPAGSTTSQRAAALTFDVLFKV